MKVFIIDLDRCNGCYNCQVACKDEHCGNEWLPYAKPQPDTGHFWLKINEKEMGSTPKIQIDYRPVMCNHCDDAPCMATGDAFYKREDGLVILDPEKAADRALVDACPYGTVYWNEKLGIAQKCTGCAHLVDEGKQPHCVDLCVMEALRFGDEEDFAKEIAQATTYVDSASGPRVHYLNDPKLFIGGEVWNPAEDEIIEGAKITLNRNGAFFAETVSDEYGDFWFKKIDGGNYSLEIEAPGFASASVPAFELTTGTNLGDFPLTAL